MCMLLSDFDYDLPPELIAQAPLADRAASRMLIVNRAAASFTDHSFSELPSHLRQDDLLVLNNTKVFPARIYGQTESGAKIEVFLIRETSNGMWEVLARPGRRLRPGKRVSFSERLTGVVTEKWPDGKLSMRFEADGDFDSILDEIGTTPLPPYIKRDLTSTDTDRERYQTTYASQRGAIAAPTAGLHFTPGILQSIRRKGVSVAEITLHVGYGTFEAVRVRDVAAHHVSAEHYSIDETTARLLNTAQSDRRRIVAVGTTTTRALESNVSDNGTFVAGNHTAGLTITPGYGFRAVGALLTNFHLPQSSLLILTSTFAGHELIMNAYRHAVATRYRFYSYGDCMFIE